MKKPKTPKRKTSKPVKFRNTNETQPQFQSDAEPDEPKQHLHKTGRLHIDRRAPALKDAMAEMEVDPLELFDTRELAALWKVSTAWLEIGRSKKYGPPWRKLTPQMIRYRRDDLMAWLDTRIHTSTAEYEKRPSREERLAAEKELRLRARIEALQAQLADVTPLPKETVKRHEPA